MQHRFAEGIPVGLGIGIAVVGIRAFTSTGGQARWVLLGIVALALIVIQILLMRRGEQKPRAEVATQVRSPGARRARRADLFANEGDQRWTGLAGAQPDDGPPQADHVPALAPGASRRRPSAPPESSDML